MKNENAGPLVPKLANFKMVTLQSIKSSMGSFKPGPRVNARPPETLEGVRCRKIKELCSSQPQACDQFSVLHLTGCLTLDREERASISSFVKWSWQCRSSSGAVKMESTEVGGELSGVRGL